MNQKHAYGGLTAAQKQKIRAAETHFNTRIDEIQAAVNSGRMSHLVARREQQKARETLDKKKRAAKGLASAAAQSAGESSTYHVINGRVVKG